MLQYLVAGPGKEISQYLGRRRGHYTEYNSEHCLFSDTVHSVVDTELFCCISIKTNT